MNITPTLNDQPPLQYNYGHSSQILHWNGSDTAALYGKNMQNMLTSKRLLSLGWQDAVIEYSYNSHGFRCQDFYHGPCAVALGCSFTEGIGLHLRQTWPHMLSSKLDFPVWNLGSGGASIDTVFRIMEHYIVRLNPQCIFILIPPESRLEFCDIHNGFPIIQIGCLGQHESFAKEWLAQPYNAIYNTRKTMLAIGHLCAKFDIPIIAMPSKADARADQYGQFDLARDLLHPGEIYQKYVADIMYQQYQQITELT